MFGEGSGKAAVMLIGEAPGRTEVEMKRPFVGRAGKNLDMFLAQIRLNREDIFITNSVKFRPTREGRDANRAPTPGEIAGMRDFLMEEIRIVGPKVIVTLGGVPLKSVTNDMKAAIGASHGRPAVLPGDGRTLFPLYHPASIIYRKELAAVYQQDLERLAAFIAEMG
ncbi:Type-4 uracil-DNA glycosylase [bioreactor metagenome]|uniref:Type-4 uracil-DNA glycosylase n=1 Tax=bioreactor metagenome TaxID=1076179 RepID=A0A645I0B5_9ZZZZ